MNFGDALYLIKSGTKMSRVGWNGKGMFICYVPGGVFEGINMLPFLAIKTASGAVVPWLASQMDILAEDWIGYDVL